MVFITCFVLTSIQYEWKSIFHLDLIVSVLWQLKAQRPWASAPLGVTAAWAHHTLHIAVFYTQLHMSDPHSEEYEALGNYSWEDGPRGLWWYLSGRDLVMLTVSVWYLERESVTQTHCASGALHHCWECNDPMMKLLVCWVTVSYSTDQTLQVSLQNVLQDLVEPSLQMDDTVFFSPQTAFYLIMKHIWLCDTHFSRCLLGHDYWPEVVKMCAALSVISSPPLNIRSFHKSICWPLVVSWGWQVGSIRKQFLFGWLQPCTTSLHITSVSKNGPVTFTSECIHHIWK